MDNFGIVVGRLKRLYSHDFLSHECDSFRVLITTIISQRNRDESTEVAARKLFSRFRTINALARANIKDVEAVLRTVGLYRQKSRRIIEVAKIIETKYRGNVPADISKLVELPGVGRKTANCVLVYAFRIPAIPVDTHVHRIGNRLGWVKTKTPDQTEQMLVKVVPRKYWLDVNGLFVRHGQSVCKPISPKCGLCSVRGYCAYYKKRRGN